MTNLFMKMIFFLNDFLYNLINESYIKNCTFYLNIQLISKSNNRKSSLKMKSQQYPIQVSNFFLNIYVFQLILFNFIDHLKLSLLHYSAICFIIVFIKCHQWIITLNVHSFMFFVNILCFVCLSNVNVKCLSNT